MAAAEALVHEQQATPEWLAALQYARQELIELADTYAPQQPIDDAKDHINSEPSEFYDYDTAGGIYRIMNSGKSYKHIELDYYPDPEKAEGEPIVKIKAYLPRPKNHLPRDRFGAPQFQMEFDYGVQAENSGHDHIVTVDCNFESGQNPEDLGMSLNLIHAAGRDLPEPKKSNPSAINMFNITNSELQQRLENKTLPKSDEQKEKDKASARTSAEKEIARAAIAELQELGPSFSGDFMGDGPIRRRDPHYQLERMYEAVEAIKRRNEYKSDDPEVSFGDQYYTHEDFSAGSRRLSIPPTAEEAVAKYLRSTVQQESKIPAEGLTKVPKDHLVVFISPFKVSRTRGKLKTDRGMRNTIYAVADDQIEFTEPFHYALGHEGDSAAVDIAFLNPADYSRKSLPTFDATEVSVYEGKQKDYYGKKIDSYRRLNRVLLLGPGDNAAVSKSRDIESDAYTVSNVEGQLFVDGKAVSQSQLRRYKKHLQRVFGKGEDSEPILAKT